MELSKRLTAVAGLVTEGAFVADVGTDHGYIPVYLIESRIAAKVIALDVNQGPLARAREHIAEHGLEGQIETRLSDGLHKVAPPEVDTMIAAGMGGGLICRILKEGDEVVDALSSLILQPQSEIAEVRRYLVEKGMRIEAEDMVFEEGKYYPVMRAVHGKEKSYEEWEYHYGRRLLEHRHPVLREYLHREIHIRQQILEALDRHETEKTRERRKEVEKELWTIAKALEYYTCADEQGRPNEREGGLGNVV